jgi:MFS family permease
MEEVTSSEAKDIKVPSYPVLLFTCCAVAGACYFGSFMRVPVIPLYARSFGADAFQVGMINAAFLLMAGIVSLPLGILSDRLGRKLLITTGLAFAAGSSFLLSFSTSTVQLVAIHLLLGLSLGMFGPTMMSYVADITPATHLGRAYGWYTLALNSGMSVGPAVGGVVAEWLGFRSVFALSGAVILLVFWMTLFFLPRARHVLINRPARRDTRALMKDLSRNAPLLSCWLATLGSCFAVGMYTTFVPLFAVEQGMDPGEIGLIFATQALFNALSRIPFGRLSDSVARRSDLVVAGLLCLTGAVASFGIASSMLAFLLCAAGLGISIGIAYTAIGALISEVVEADSRGLAMGGYNSCIYLGMMLSSLVMGALVGDLGYSNCFFIVALTNLVTTGIFYLGMRESGVVSRS